jgi:hypothetical protein
MSTIEDVTKILEYHEKSLVQHDLRSGEFSNILVFAQFLEKNNYKIRYAVLQ